MAKTGPTRRPVWERMTPNIAFAGINECWLWTGRVNPGGYGCTNIGRTSLNTHKASWLTHFGEVPAGMCVCHRCDTPACVNPSHLFLATKKDNSGDMVKKGRSKHGARHYASKLTEDDVRAIRKSAMSMMALAKAYGVTHGTIHDVIMRETWRHI